MTAWKGGAWHSQRGGLGPWRGGPWLSQRGGGGGTDWSQVSVGDYVEGGVYAGIITYADAREFHLIFAVQSGELAPSGNDTRWKTSNSSTSGASSTDDGYANTQAIIAAGIGLHPAAEHCVNYSSGGFGDFYLPADNELSKANALRAASHPEFVTDISGNRWTSRQAGSSFAYFMLLSNGVFSNTGKTNTNNYVRPVRRVPV